MKNTPTKIDANSANVAALPAENARERKQPHRQHRRRGPGARQATNPATSNAPSDECAERPRRCPNPRCCHARAPTRVRTPPPLTRTSPRRSSAAVFAEALFDAPQRQRQHNQADGHVEPEDPLPGDAVGHRSADHGPTDHREAGDALEDPDCAASALGRIGRGDDRQGERDHHRRAHALYGPGRDQPVHVRGTARRLPRPLRKAPFPPRTCAAARSDRRAPLPA